MTKIGVAEIYQSGNTLYEKAAHGAGGVDDEMIARAEAAMADLHGEYLTWAAQDIQTIERQCADAMALPGNECSHALRELFAVVHGMKGQGGSFGFPLVTMVADSLARFIEGCSRWGADEMDVITVHVNALRTVIVERLTDDGGVAGEEMMIGLQRALDKFGRS